MAFTKHGHPYPGDFDGHPPLLEERCQKIPNCVDCTREAIIVLNGWPESESSLDLMLDMFSNAGINAWNAYKLLYRMVVRGVRFHDKDLCVLPLPPTEPVPMGVKNMRWGAPKTEPVISIGDFAQIRRAYEFFERAGVSPDGRWEMIELLRRDGVSLNEVIGD